MNGSYYAVIPAKVLHDKDLLKYPKSILLYGHIANLANQKGYCWATNKYFMEQLCVKSATTITDYLNLLVRKGFIKKKNIYKEGTKQIEKRVISIDTGTPIPADCNSPIPSDCNSPIPSDCNSPIPSDCKENNTSINNTRINNTTTTTAFVEYQKMVGILSPNQNIVLSDYIQRLSDDVVKFAINVMVDATTTPNFNYLNRILMRYEDLGINTVEKAEALEKEHQAKKKPKKKAVKRQSKPSEEWGGW